MLVYYVCFYNPPQNDEGPSEREPGVEEYAETQKHVHLFNVRLYIPAAIVVYRYGEVSFGR